MSAPAAASSSSSAAVLTPTELATIFRKLKAQNGNKTCFDCNAKNPNWTSIPFGVYLCMDCSAIHRRMGTHISFVRSSMLDKWTREQVAFMVAGGNDKARDFFKQRGWADHEADKRKEKYTSKAALQYKAQLERDAKQAQFTLDDFIGSPAHGPTAAKNPHDLDNEQGLDDMLASMTVPAGASKSASPSGSPMPSSSPEPRAPSPPARAVVKEHARAPSPPKRVVIKKHTETEPAHEKEVIHTIAVGQKKIHSEKPKTSILSTAKPKATAAKVSVAAAASNDGDDFDDMFNKMSMEDSRPKPKAEPEEEDKVEVKEKRPTTPSSATAKEAAPQQPVAQPKPTPAKTETRDPKVPPPWHERHNAASGAAAKSKKEKSMSSDQFFQREQYAPADEATKSKLQSFSGARAISSDAFFDRETAADVEEDGVDLSNLKQTLQDKGRAIKEAASGLISSLGNRYG